MAQDRGPGSSVIICAMVACVCVCVCVRVRVCMCSQEHALVGVLHIPDADICL